MIENLGERLRNLRTSQHISQTDLSKRIGVTNALISAIEKGERSPSLETLIKLASYFKVSTDYLLGIKAKEPVNLDGLSSNEVQAIITIINSLKNKDN
ncbi:helix-turn-helix domain-containing protein [Lacrimispora sphenoides]|uniref:DNA-binding transcriptional regulator, XRE-family HTH domain n=1 Tax=Lacrimispora sphenoides JCM 1415 TaxID=1297793 RepID=A0ABY1CHC1_9FIRM|nr:helix-turn-helix transcriptional regulator [Lacrimispora sphenoides]SEU04049.1 DNA-binding transcriptional regulator, XRE-family HTH domain [[Clostridium] sphenoides JCM 1415]SUY48842.1 transcriptional regulator [Lacrimispora sphenoides]